MTPFPEGVLRPWEQHGSRGVVSLFDMFQFYGDIFSEYLPWIAVCEFRLSSEEKRETQVDPITVAAIGAKVGVLQGVVSLYELKSVFDQCARIRKSLDDKGMIISCGDLRDHLHNLRLRIEDDFKSALLLHLSVGQASLYQEPLKDWESVISKFSKVRYNIEEAEKCFALERYGAAVFHIMLVAEYGVIQVAKLMGVGGDKPGWGSLEKLEKILSTSYKDRTPFEQTHSKMLAAVVPLTKVFKDNWRHKMDHIDNQISWIDTDFSPNVAQEIILATRGFMRKLASELQN